MNKQILLASVEKKLQKIYKEEYQACFIQDFEVLIDRWMKQEWGTNEPITERNVYLITYADSIFEKGKPTLESLHHFLKKEAINTITDIHLLPMFPYTSDDGFSVVDYRMINPPFGTWKDIDKLSEDFRLMFDFVANHLSKSSEWFQGFINGDKKYHHYFIPKDSKFDTTNVVRPRTSPLFHSYEGNGQTKTVWTTFSEDQVDLNYHHFPVLLKMTDILLSYVHKGGSSIRLDAIGFIWKETGTSCMHLPAAHLIIQIWREVLDFFQPNTQIITETNVPHKENISYFGNGKNEAHMVYQFSLPPLVLYTLTTHDATKISNWAKTIHKISNQATYFNFLASHDGIGMRPVEGILSEDEKQLLMDKVLENGGRISYKTNADGSKSVYELNINYSNALINKGEDDTEEMAVKKMLAAHSILLSVIGVPAIYYHSLLGSENDSKGLEETGMNRRINREKLEWNNLLEELQSNSRRKAIFTGLKKLIKIRRQHSAFSPFASQSILHFGKKVFACKRRNEETGEEIYFLLNVDSKPVTIPFVKKGLDLITGAEMDGVIKLEGYDFVWLKN
ncbi:sugar phosphorylase [Bacillaceae bacterium Marseille-Q3522]|nr:sugar phosphorylase [Bacillaceae bacterium Marseille-Q3522]